MSSFYFGVSNSNSKNSPILVNANSIFNLEDPQIIKILKGNPENRLLPMVHIESENANNDYNYLRPPIFEHFDELKHCLSHFKENEILTHRKALYQVGFSLNKVNVEKIRLSLNQLLLNFYLVESNVPCEPNINYSNSLKAVNTTFSSVKSFMDYTFYTLVRYKNPYLEQCVNYTAEVDGFYENRPIEFKSEEQSKMLDKNGSRFTTSREQFLYMYPKNKKIKYGVQCQRAGVKDIIFGLHDGNQMRLEHFFLKDFIKGVEPDVEAKIDKQDKSLANAILKNA